MNRSGERKRRYDCDCDYEHEHEHEHEHEQEGEGEGEMTRLQPGFHWKANHASFSETILPATQSESFVLVLVIEQGSR